MAETDDWVLTFSFARDLDDAELDTLSEFLEENDGSVARVPGDGVTVTIRIPGHLSMTYAAYMPLEFIATMLHEQPVSLEILREPEYAHRAEVPTLQ